MSSIEPSPQTTLVIFLGASEWSLSSLRSSPAFTESANKIRDYFCHSRLFGLPPENWLDLFNKHQSNPNEVDQVISKFLDQRILELKRAGTPARDVLFYYIGHGVFANYEQAYHLAIQSTRDENIGSSSIQMASLAYTLKTKARYLRRIVILDCCFAAQSFKYMQAAPDQVAIQQTFSALEEKSIGKGFPRRGTALLCSSGHKAASLILPDDSGTMFSEALVRALSLEKIHQPHKTHLSLYDLKQPIIDMLDILAGENAPRPELHSPDQSYGDVASVPLFPNLRVKEERHRAEEQARRIEEELIRIPSTIPIWPTKKDTSGTTPGVPPSVPPFPQLRQTQFPPLSKPLPIAPVPSSTQRAQALTAPTISTQLSRRDIDNREAEIRREIRRQKLTQLMEAPAFRIGVAIVGWVAGMAVIVGIENFLVTAEGSEIVNSLSGSTPRSASIGSAMMIEIIVFGSVYMGAHGVCRSSWLRLFLAGFCTEGIIWLSMLVQPYDPGPTALDWQVLSSAFYATLALGFVYALVALSLRVANRLG